MAIINKVGQGDLYHVHFVDAVDPGYGRPGGGHPDQGLPGHGGHPDHGLPGRPPHVGGGPIFHPGHPDHGLPSQPGHPGNRPPGSGNPVFPDNSLPSHPPPQVAPGQVIVLIRGADGKWKYAALVPGTPPPRPLPEPPAPDQGLPPTPPPTAGQPLPPAAAPKA
jgi:hypothetical protein